MLGEKSMLQQCLADLDCVEKRCQALSLSFDMGRGGEIFVLEMGKSVKIRYLAEQMIRLSGKQPGEDIQIVYTGLRAGEKMFEELFYDQESLSATQHEKILLAASSLPDWEDYNDQLSRLLRLSEAFEDTALREQIWAMVPERHGDRNMNGSTSESAEIIHIKAQKNE